VSLPREIEEAQFALGELRCENPNVSEKNRALLLPGALLVAIGAQLFAAFMLVDLRFSTLFQ
jgi:hypothetical protein